VDHGAAAVCSAISGQLARLQRRPAGLTPVHLLRYVCSSWYCTLCGAPSYAAAPGSNAAAATWHGGRCGGALPLVPAQQRCSVLRQQPQRWICVHAGDEDESLYVNWWDNPYNPDLWKKHQVRMYEPCVGAARSVLLPSRSGFAATHDFHIAANPMLLWHQPMLQQWLQPPLSDPALSTVAVATACCVCNPPQLAWWAVAFWGAVFYTAFGGKKKEPAAAPAAAEAKPTAAH
jgi:hypothetical protein